MGCECIRPHSHQRKCHSGYCSDVGESQVCMPRHDRDKTRDMPCRAMQCCLSYLSIDLSFSSDSYVVFCVPLPLCLNHSFITRISRSRLRSDHLSSVSGTQHFFPSLSPPPPSPFSLCFSQSSYSLLFNSILLSHSISFYFYHGVCSPFCVGFFKFICTFIFSL